MPVGVFELGHYELTSWSPLTCPKAAIVYAGLVFSALTVLGSSTDMFGSKVRAIGFTALLEGIMMTADAGWLSAIALCYLVVINAIANGCRLALRDTTAAVATVDWPANLARAIRNDLPDEIRGCCTRQQLIDKTGTRGRRSMQDLATTVGASPVTDACYRCRSEMSANRFGRRYITQRQFVEYAKDTGLDPPFLASIIEFAERFCILAPAARVRFPDPVVRRWYRDRHPHEGVLAPIEPDGACLSAATELMNALSLDLMSRGTAEHPLDSLAPVHHAFVTKEFSRSTFVPWHNLRTPLFIRDGVTITGEEAIYTYYHSWQIFQLAAFLRSGLSVLYDVGTERTWESLSDLRRNDIYAVANIDARRELNALRENATLFDAVTAFEDRRDRALRIHARSATDSSTRRLSRSASSAYRSQETAIAREVVLKAKLTPQKVIAFIQLQCELWGDARTRHPASIATEYKRTIQTTIELLRLANPRYSGPTIMKRVGAPGGYRRPILEVIFPDWISEHRTMVEASLRRWIVPSLAKMPSQFAYSDADVTRLCKWIEQRGFLQLYWHFRRLVDIGPLDDQIGRTAATVEIIGLASLVEQIANQALADRKPSQAVAGTLYPKLMALFAMMSPLAVGLKEHWSLTGTKKRTLRQQLAQIDRMRSAGPNTSVLKALLRLVLIRNASIHGGLPGFGRQQMQSLIESLLIAALIIWKAG